MSTRFSLFNVARLLIALSLGSSITFLISAPAQTIPDCDGPNPPPICERPRPTPSPQPEPPGTDVSVPATLLSALANNLVQGSQLHLNNFGPKHGNSWHKANDSFARLSSQLGGQEYRFNIPEKTVDLDCGLLCPDLGTGRFYIQDWKVQTVQVGWQSPQFKLSLAFESSGREIKGFHTGSVSLGDDGMPDANVDNARLDVYIRPVVSNGRLSYQVASTDFNASIQATGACNVFGIDICNFFTNYKQDLRNQIESQVRTRLNDAALRDRVANAVQPILNQFGIGTITKVSVKGDTLIIRHTGR